MDEQDNYDEQDNAAMELFAANARLDIAVAALKKIKERFGVGYEVWKIASDALDEIEKVPEG